MKIIPVILFTFIAINAFSQKDTALVKFVNPGAVSKPKGYSATVQVDLGPSTMILISGQVPFDKEAHLTGKGDFEQQAVQIFSNIKSIVEEAGGTMDNVVKLNYYITDISKLQILRDTRDKFVNTKNPPASTLVQVSKLFRDDVMLEVEATVVIPKK